MEKSKLITAFLLLFIGMNLTAQPYMTRTGYIRFYSEAPLENIEAVNRQVNSALNPATGEFVFRVLMRSFNFEKALMQEHFNENYVESHKYPNASFQGKVVNMEEVDFSKPGVYNAVVEGNLTIKDATHKVRETGTLEIKGDEVIGKCIFVIKLADYNISIPSAVSRNISETIEITVEVNLKKG
jgi:polyisoprenoid-binding protein YceI